MVDEIDKWVQATEAMEERTILSTRRARELMNGDEEAIEDAKSHNIKWINIKDKFKITEEVF